MKNIAALLFSVFYFVGNSQVQSTKLFWEKLYYAPQNDIQVNPVGEFSNYELDTLLKGKIDGTSVYPLKNGKETYCWVNGTGRLYQVHADTSRKLSFSRLDSTEIFGYNFGAFPFIYKNNIYNIGGYGIWRMNGQLRIYNHKAKEWDIVQLNKEILIGKSRETGDGLLWYNSKTGKIYHAYYYQLNQAIRDENIPIPDVYILDLGKKEWTKLGELTEYITSNINKIGTIAMSPWGLLCFTDFKILLLSFEKNRVYILKEKVPYKQNLSRSFGSTFFFLDSTLYFSNTKGNKFDSIQISLRDFENNGIKLYSKNNRYWNIIYFTVSFFIIVAALVIFFLRRKKPRIISPLKENNTSFPLHENTYLQFEETELEVLKLLYDNSLLAKTTSIEELNRMMGLSKKNTDIQKKQRSDMILAINRKASVLTKQNGPVIDKQRSDFDKRSFDYFIPLERMRDMQKLLKGNNT